MYYPTIYDAREIRTTGKLPEHDGKGTLSDALSCKVTMAADGTYELDMTYPAAGKNAKHLQADQLLRVNLDRLAPEKAQNFQFFRIATVERTLTSEGDTLQIHAEHLSYDLKWLYCPPNTDKIRTVDGVLSYIRLHTWGECPFEYKNAAPEEILLDGFRFAEPFTVREAIFAIQELWGTGVEYDNLTVRFVEPSSSTRTLRKGKNLVDLTVNRDLSQGVTGVYMYFLTDDKYVRPILVTPYDKDTYGVPHYITHNYADNSEIELDVLTVKEFGEYWLKQNYTPSPAANYTAHIADNKDEDYKLGDLVELDVSGWDLPTTDRTLKIQKITYDALRGTYDSIEAGSVVQDVADTIASLVGGQPTIRSTTESGIAADYIIESKSSGVWQYRRYNSGAMEMFGKIPVKNAAVNISMEMLFRSDNLYSAATYAYPIPFVSEPVVTANFVSDNNTSGMLWINPTTADNSKKYPQSAFLVRHDNGAVCNGYISMHAVGRWQ